MNTDLFGNETKGDKADNGKRPLELPVSPLSQVTNEDCMDLMKRYSDKFFDLAVVDPPYGIGNFVQATGNVRGKKVEWNNSIPNAEYFKELERISKHRIVWGANYYNCFDTIGGAIIWVKNQPMEDFSKAEIASCSLHKRVELYEQTWTNYVNTKGTSHPSEKPIALYKWIFNKYTSEGQTILDTHLGSGSSRIAAWEMKLNFTGCELDKDYFEAQESRFKKFISQGTLF